MAATSENIPPKNRIGTRTANPARTGKTLIIPLTIHIISEYIGMMIPAPRITVVGTRNRKTIPKIPINRNARP